MVAYPHWRTLTRYRFPFNTHFHLPPPHLLPPNLLPPSLHATTHQSGRTRRRPLPRAARRVLLGAPARTLLLHRSPVTLARLPTPRPRAARRVPAAVPVPTRRCLLWPAHWGTTARPVRPTARAAQPVAPVAARQPYPSPVVPDHILTAEQPRARPVRPVWPVRTLRPLLQLQPAARERMPRAVQLNARRVQPGLPAPTPPRLKWLRVRLGRTRSRARQAARCVQPDHTARPPRLHPWPVLLARTLWQAPSHARLVRQGFTVRMWRQTRSHPVHRARIPSSSSRRAR